MTLSKVFKSFLEFLRSIRVGIARFNVIREVVLRGTIGIYGIVFGCFNVGCVCVRSSGEKLPGDHHGHGDEKSATIRGDTLALGESSAAQPGTGCGG